MKSRREIAAHTLHWTGTRWLVGRLARWHGVLTLNYHRLGNVAQAPWDRAVFSATAEDFARQLAFLARNFDVIVPEEIPQTLARRGRAVLITFDDGYRDNYTAAFPALRAQGLRATFFLATGFLDHPRLPWWDEVAWMIRATPQHQLALCCAPPIHIDRPHCSSAIDAALRIYKRLPTTQTAPFLDALAHAAGTGRAPAALAHDAWMTWDMVREMAAAGMTIGGHTVTHEILGHMAESDQRREIHGCRDRIVAETHRPMTTFSYPVGKPGAFSDLTKRLLAEAGVQFAFTYSGGLLVTPPHDLYAIPRIGVESDTSLPRFKAMLALPHRLA